MSYDITIIGGQMIRVTDEQGEFLKELKLNGKPGDNIELGDDLMELGRIKLIQKVSEPRVKELPEHSVDKDRCRGKHSIQKEIMTLIRKKYPTEWPKYFQDAAYKEKVRLWLRESAPGPWCDAKMNECACTADYAPTGLETSSLLKMFPGAETTDVPEEVRRDLA